MGKKFRRTAAAAPRGGEIGYCVLLLVFFALGTAAGSFLSDRWDTAEELALYLSAFLAQGAEVGTGGMFRAAALYFRYPLIVFFLGLCPLGKALTVPVLFFLGAEFSFSAAAFLAVLGKEGIWAVVCALGIRAALVLPCCFVLACGDGARRLRNFGVVSAVLAAGICVEMYLAPRLLEYALSGLHF